MWHVSWFLAGGVPEAELRPAHRAHHRVVRAQAECRRGPDTRVNSWQIIPRINRHFEQTIDEEITLAIWTSEPVHHDCNDCPVFAKYSPHLSLSSAAVSELTRSLLWVGRAGRGRCVSTPSTGNSMCSTSQPEATGVILIRVCSGTWQWKLVLIKNRRK